jgi:single-strand DNA-binding protein
MSSLNAVTLVGHFGRKPELHYTPTQAAYALLSVATNEMLRDKGQNPRERTEWHRIVTWGRTAAACAQHLDAGRQVLVRGRLRTRSWTDRQGVQRWATEVIADCVIFLGAGTKRPSEPVDQAEPPPPEDPPAGAEDEIPF